MIHLGIGGLTNLYTYYVPIHRHNALQIEKQIEAPKVEVVPNSDQIGAGEEDEVLNKEIKSKMNPKVYESFQHPRFVQTEKINFELKRSRPKISNEESEVKKPKLAKGGSSKVKHKFQFY